MQSKQRSMLILLTFLLVIKFVIIPILDWQQEQITKIQVMSKRLTKVEQVLERLPTIKVALKSVQEENSLLQEKYYNNTSINTFKLQLQQQIERLFEQHNLTVKNFNWVLGVKGKLDQERANISFRGKTKDFALLQIAIARLPKLINTAQWTLHIKKMNDESLGEANGTLILIAYNISSKVKEL